MKSTVRSAFLYTATLSGLLILSACGKSEQPAANQPAAASTATAPAAASTAATAPAPASTAPAAAPASAGTAATPAMTNAAATPPATPAAAPADAFKVASLAVGDSVNAEHKVRKAEDHFAPNQKTLYASVLTDGSTNGATLNATWRYLEGKGQLVSSISQRIATSGPATTTFKVENPNLWPEGKYKVDITLDGKQVASQNFEVKKR
ncbi:hypothetical protein [Rhodanobacter glycinis]|uniref:Uncharacterized protein n=1 Tax=Rhodanobacter glycinis TaxID=582702 RepID=A0A1I3Z4W6_9GAMM|nr:hypothetical protein [Rhodanobacter glycinis]SFK39124.1 hypothetical protein SAMN05192579_102205 [Rhodanobacter glycinis]